MWRMPTKAQQREETTRTLVATARDLFAGKGFAHVSLNEIAQVAGVTKGALYHYYAGKDDVFRVVLGQIHEELAAEVGAVAAGDPWRSLVQGCRTFLELATDARNRRILLVDAPAVLGWEAWRELDENASMRHLIDQLRVLVDAGLMADQPLEPLAHLISGALNEAALWLAASTEPERDRDQVMASLERLLDGLKR
jgi:AcrR family transcriptional regulator